MRKRKRIHVSEGGGISDSKVREWFDGGWDEIEKATGLALSPSVRARIIETVHKYANMAQDEQNAPYQGDALDRIKHLQRAAIAFKGALTNRGFLSDAESRVINVIIQQQLRQLRPPALGVSDSIATTNKFIVACKRAVVVLKNTPGFLEGDAWRYLIKGLSRTLAAEGLAVGASQETGDSPFVALVTAVQARLPKNLRRHDRAGRPSLAKEINRARARRDKLPARSRLEMSRQAAAGQ